MHWDHFKCNVMFVDYFIRGKNIKKEAKKIGNKIFEKFDIEKIDYSKNYKCCLGCEANDNECFKLNCYDDNYNFQWKWRVVNG